MMARKIGFALVLLALVIGLSPRAFAQGQQIVVVPTCGAQSLSPSPPTKSFTYMDETGSLCVNASVSASITGFTPATTGTPISVTTGGVTGTLPAGAVVVASNVGATNGAYCKLGASATTSDQLIPPNSWFAFTVGAATQLTCITSSSTTTVNMVGGSGLATGSGGGGGGSGGGGAVTIADGADVTLGAKADAKSTATDTTPITLMSVAKQISASVQAAAASLAGTLTASVTNAGTFLVQAAQSGTWNITNVSGTVSLPTGASTAANQATEIGSLATIATNSAAPIPAQSNTTSVVNIGNVGQTNGDPCSTQAHVYTTISNSTAAAAVLVAGVSSKKKYICALMLKNNAANNVAIYAGHGSTCGTSAVAIMGGTTTGTGFILAANDGFVAGSGTNAIAATTVNADDVCINLSAASQVSGYIVTTDQ